MSDVKTYVAGHKSPDTDSICSAISFANFLTQMGTPATPVCAGEACLLYTSPSPRDCS